MEEIIIVDEAEYRRKKYQELIDKIYNSINLAKDKDENTNKNNKGETLQTDS